MGVTVGIGLVVTRLLIRFIGVSDFGLLTALGASGALLSMLRDALNASGVRHMAHEIGREDDAALRRVFASSLLIHLAAGGGIVLLGALLMPGIIYVVQIPEGRQVAAWWVLGATIVRVGVALAVTPYSAMITARQEIPISTAFELVGRLATLAVVLVLLITPADRLATYAVLTLLASTVLEALMVLVCMVRYPACRQGIRGASRTMAAELLSFGGWAVLLAMATRVRLQGTVFLLNVLFGTVVNASYAIAVQVVSYQSQLTWALMSAIQPAMATMYGRGGQSTGVNQLVHMANKFPFYVSFLLFVPVWWETEMVLTLWLSDYPDWTPLFVRIAMVTMLFETISSGYAILMSARGQLRTLTILGVAFQLAAVVIGWFGAATFSWGPSGFVWAALAATGIWSIVRAIYVSIVTEMPASDFIWRSLAPISGVSAVTLVSSGVVYALLAPGYVRLGLIVVITTLATLVAAWTIGLTSFERHHCRRVASVAAMKLQSIIKRRSTFPQPPKP